MLRLKTVQAAPVRTKLAKSTDGACERQPQILKRVNTGDGTLLSPSGGKRGFPVHKEAFPTRGYFLIAANGKKNYETAGGFFRRERPWNAYNMHQTIVTDHRIGYTMVVDDHYDVLTVVHFPEIGHKTRLDGRKPNNTCTAAMVYHPVSLALASERTCNA